ETHPHPWRTTMKASARSLTAAPLVLVLAVGGLGAADEDEQAQELAKFQGTWKTAAMVIDGRQVPDEELEFRRVIIIDDKYAVVDGNRTIQRGSFRLDPTKDPKQI